MYFVSVSLLGSFYAKVGLLLGQDELYLDRLRYYYLRKVDGEVRKNFEVVSCCRKGGGVPMVVTPEFKKLHRKERSPHEPWIELP